MLEMQSRSHGLSLKASWGQGGTVTVWLWFLLLMILAWVTISTHRPQPNLIEHCFLTVPPEQVSWIWNIHMGLSPCWATADILHKMPFHPKRQTSRHYWTTPQSKSGFKVLYFVNQKSALYYDTGNKPFLGLPFTFLVASSPVSRACLLLEVISSV